MITIVMIMCKWMVMYDHTIDPRNCKQWKVVTKSDATLHLCPSLGGDDSYEPGRKGALLGEFKTQHMY